MAFSVSKSRRFRSLGLYKSSGKHAAPKGWVPAPRLPVEPVESAALSRKPAHAVSMPRLTGPHGEGDQQAA